MNKEKPNTTARSLRDDTVRKLRDFIEENFTGTKVFINFQNPIHGKIGLFAVPTDKSFQENKMQDFMSLPEIAQSSALIKKSEEKPESLRQLFSQFKNGQYFIIAGVDENDKIDKFFGLSGILKSQQAEERSKEKLINSAEQVIYLNQDYARAKIGLQVSHTLQSFAFPAYRVDELIYTAKLNNPSISIIKILVNKNSDELIDGNYVSFFISSKEYKGCRKAIKFNVNRSIENVTTNAQKEIQRGKDYKIFSSPKL